MLSDDCLQCQLEPCVIVNHLASAISWLLPHQNKCEYRMQAAVKETPQERLKRLMAAQLNKQVRNGAPGSVRVLLARMPCSPDAWPAYREQSRDCSKDRNIVCGKQVKKDSVAVAQKRQEAEADAVARRQIERGLLHSDRRSPSPQR